MPGFRSAAQAVAVMTVGVIPMIVEGIIVFTGHSLSTGNEIVLWAGVGVFALGAIMLMFVSVSDSG